MGPLHSGLMFLIASQLPYCLTACFLVLGMACMYLLISALVFALNVSHLICLFLNVPSVRGRVGGQGSLSLDDRHRDRVPVITEVMLWRFISTPGSTAQKNK